LEAAAGGQNSGEERGGLSNACVPEVDGALGRRPRWSVGSGSQWRGELGKERQWRSTGREQRREDARGEMRAPLIGAWLRLAAGGEKEGAQTRTGTGVGGRRA
jgi:hypothetical protein